MDISRIKDFRGHLWSFVYLRLYEAAEHFIELRKRRRKSNLKLTDGSDMPVYFQLIPNTVCWLPLWDGLVHSAEIAAIRGAEITGILDKIG